MRLEADLALGTEAAAEVRHDDADPVLRQAEGLRDASPGRERHLGRRPDRDVVALPLGEDRPRLDRDGVRAVGDVAALDDDVGLRHPGVRVALDDRRVRGDVPFADDVVIDLVNRPVVVDELAVGTDGRLQVRNGREDLQIDVDQRRGAGRDLRRGRGDGGDQLPFPADDIPGEQRAVLHEGAVPDVGHVGRGQDGMDAGERSGRGRIETADAGM